MAEAINRILVPVDFNAHSDRALAYATTLAARLGASVELLHVVDNSFVTGAWSSEWVPELPQMLDSMISSADRRLAAMKADVARHGVKASTNVLTGHPAHTIVEHAKTGFDLVVMGTHGRTGFSHIFMGSVAERVVRQASCPVLTVRAAAPAADKELPTAGKAVA